MPATFLTQTERLAYDQVPKVEPGDLQQWFFLTQADKKFVAMFHGSINRLAMAIQLCLIRYFGFVQDNWKDQLTDDITSFVSDQLAQGKLPLSFLSAYGSRQPTRSGHQQQILKHLGFKKWQPMDEPFLEQWLVQQGMEHDNERWLLDRLCQKLHQDKVLRPAIGTLERMVGSASERLHEQTYQRLSSFWNDHFCKMLDNLLILDPRLRLTTHRWLCTAPTGNAHRDINNTLQKITFLQSIGVDGWDIHVISPNRRKRLANMVRNNSNSYLQRIAPLRRYPLLVCFLWETLLDTTDSVLTMYNDFWQHATNDAKRALEEHRLSVAKSQAQAVQALTKTVEMVMDDGIEPWQLRDAIFRYLPKPKLQEALNIVSRSTKSMQQTPLLFLIGQYQRFRAFCPNFLRTVHFEMAFSRDNFTTALDLVVQSQNGRIRKIPENAPANFIAQSWSKLIFNDGLLDTKAYELCVLSVLRDRLLSGDIFVKLSRRFADFNSFLIPKQHWQRESGNICLQFGGIDINGRIDQRVAELSSLLAPLSALLAKGTEIRLDDGVLVVPQIEGEDVPQSVKSLKEQINQRLPQVGLADIIREVDGWVDYSNELREDITFRNSEHRSLRYAALMGNGCNLSLADLARSSELDYQSLWWVANNYFSDENLKRANNRLVNFHNKQWISSCWGDGSLSSSDGQRFPTSGKIRNAQSIPRYFGYGKGVTFYTHTSDQYSQYGTKVICATERDATYVLDEILANETDLVMLEHTTDTHGYTDLLFAFFDLVDKSFAPRLRDIKDQRLCKIKMSGDGAVEREYPQLKFSGAVNIDYLKKHADELRRVAASLQTGTVTASLLMGKLQAYPRQNNLMYVLQAYGQLNKTIFICKYLLELPLRHKINAQLNKGEQLHNLRVYLWFGGDGIIRKKQEKEQQVTAWCLNLLTNIVLVWNTVYIQKVIEQLKNEGYQINEDDLRRISPAPFEHINRLGKYDFKNAISMEQNSLRPLRRPKP